MISLSQAVANGSILIEGPHNNREASTKNTISMDKNTISMDDAIVRGDGLYDAGLDLVLSLGSGSSSPLRAPVVLLEADLSNHNLYVFEAFFDGYPLGLLDKEGHLWRSWRYVIYSKPVAAVIYRTPTRAIAFTKSLLDLYHHLEDSIYEAKDGRSVMERARGQLAHRQ